jgi:hypothetical protein
VKGRWENGILFRERDRKGGISLGRIEKEVFKQTGREKEMREGDICSIQRKILKAKRMVAEKFYVKEMNREDKTIEENIEMVKAIKLYGPHV